MALVLNGDGSVGPLSATELGYLDGVTSAVQTQLNGKAASDVAISLANPGYVRLGSGLILQWGTSANVGQRTGISITFPIAFPNACFNVQGTVDAGAAFSGKGVSILSISATDTALSHDVGASTSIKWFAVGW